IGSQLADQIPSFGGGGGHEQVGLGRDPLLGLQPLGTFVTGLRIAVLHRADRVHAHGEGRTDGFPGDVMGAQTRLGGDPIVGPDEFGGTEVRMVDEQPGEFVDGVGEFVLRPGVDRQVVQRDRFGDLQPLTGAAGAVDPAGVGGEHIDPVPGGGERTHGLVDVDVHSPGIALAGLSGGRGVEGQDGDAHGDSLANHQPKNSPRIPRTAGRPGHRIDPAGSTSRSEPGMAAWIASATSTGCAGSSSCVRTRTSPAKSRRFSADSEVSSTAISRARPSPSDMSVRTRFSAFDLVQDRAGGIWATSAGSRESMRSTIPSMSSAATRLRSLSRWERLASATSAEKLVKEAGSTSAILSRSAVTGCAVLSRWSSPPADIDTPRARLAE